MNIKEKRKKEGKCMKEFLSEVTVAIIITSSPL